MEEEDGQKRGQLLDLLYPENRFTRVKECLKRYSEDGGGISGPLHRVTLFLTFKCNLNCYYCNTIRPRPNNQLPGGRGDYDLKRFIRFINLVLNHDIHHLHLTGGEVTLVKELPQMIRYASDLNIPCSITTNGTAPPEVYKDLVQAGLREIRISLDTLNEALFDKNVGKKGAFQKVLKAIREIIKLRDLEDKNIYLILNVCVGQNGLKRLPNTVKQIGGLGSDDIKLIGISHDRDLMPNYGSAFKIVHSIETYINASDRPFYLLKKKLKTIFSQDTYGIEDFASMRLMRSCFIPLTEKTVDTHYYYPCPVYLREGGAPLGSLHDDLKTQHDKVLSFIMGNECVKDPICQKSCIYCTKVFNNHMNAAHYKTIRSASGDFEPVTKEIRYEKRFSMETIAKTMNVIGHERSGFSRSLDSPSFLIIKPNGLKFEKKILSLLNQKKMGVHKIKKIKDWNKLALKIYTHPMTLWNVHRGLLFDKVLPLLEGRADAKMIIFKEEYALSTLKKTKEWIRQDLPPENYIIFHQDEVFVTSPGHVHSPDENNPWIEFNVFTSVL